MFLFSLTSSAQAATVAGPVRVAATVESAACGGFGTTLAEMTFNLPGGLYAMALDRDGMILFSITTVHDSYTVVATAGAPLDLMDAGAVHARGWVTVTYAYCYFTFFEPIVSYEVEAALQFGP